MGENKCEQCGEMYVPRQLGQRFCSKQCSDRWWAAERRRGIEALRSGRYDGRELVDARPPLGIEPEELNQ